MNGWHEAKKTRLFRVAIVCGVLFMLIVWNPGRLLSPVRAVFGFVALPFEQVFSVLGFHVGSAVDFFSSVGSLKEESERLMHDNVRLTAENAKLADIQKENEMLRRQFDLLPKGSFRMEAAEVIGRDEQNSGNWLLIGKGSSDGIRKGMAVIVDQGVLVGRVSEVSSESARVVLVTSPESVINAIDAKTEAKGIVRGQYGLGVAMDTVLRSDVLDQGDDIVTSGLGGDFPRGLFLGKIESSRSSDDRLFQQASLIPATDFSRLRMVFVITESL